MNTLVRENRNANQQQSEQFVTPAASVIEDGDAYLLNVEMPGVNKDGLEISVENNELRIIGRRSLPAIEGTLVHRESRSENFRRMFDQLHITVGVYFTVQWRKELQKINSFDDIFRPESPPRLIQRRRRRQMSCPCGDSRNQNTHSRA